MCAMMMMVCELLMGDECPPSSGLVVAIIVKEGIAAHTFIDEIVVKHP